MEIKKGDLVRCVKKDKFFSDRFEVGDMHVISDVVTKTKIEFKFPNGSCSIGTDRFNNIFELVESSHYRNIDKEQKSVIQDPQPIQLPEYYNNENGSLYKVATERGWNPYLFDVVKRLERGGKKDPLPQEIEKSIGVLQLWLKEQSND